MDMNHIHTVVFLRNEWWKLCERLGVKDADLVKEINSMLIGRYSENGRHYHDLSHIEHCLKELQEVRHLCDFPNETEMALWFHDAVYDVTRNDNESLSAIFCTQRLLAMGLSENPKLMARIHAMILFTMHKELPIRDASFVVDIDLSSLGASQEIFDKNTEKIFLEYHEGRGMTREEFNVGRANWIKTMLPPHRPHIYSTEYFKTKYEAQAQENLKRSLEELKTGV